MRAFVSALIEVDIEQMIECFFLIEYLLCAIAGKKGTCSESPAHKVHPPIERACSEKGLERGEFNYDPLYSEFEGQHEEEELVVEEVTEYQGVIPSKLAASHHVNQVHQYEGIEHDCVVLLNSC